VMQERKCEAPIHRKKCPCVSCIKENYCGQCGFATHDHFQPKSITALMGNEISGRPENLQWLSPTCHRRKDRSTRKRVMMLEAIQSGAFFSLADYRVWRNKYDLLFVKGR
jgi:hypothetical protein